MLDGVVEIFDGYRELQKRLKKKQYKERKEEALRKNGEPVTFEEK